MRKRSQPVTDESYIRKYGSWNSWPFCPLKRKNNNLESKNLGVLLCTQDFEDALQGKSGAKFIVYHVYMFDPPKTREEWDAAPKTEYNTLAELLADGWVVD